MKSLYILIAFCLLALMILTIGLSIHYNSEKSFREDQKNQQRQAVIIDLRSNQFDVSADLAVPINGTKTVSGIPHDVVLICTDGRTLRMQSLDTYIDSSNGRLHKIEIQTLAKEATDLAVEAKSLARSLLADDTQAMCIAEDRIKNWLVYGPARKAGWWPRASLFRYSQHASVQVGVMQCFSNDDCWQLRVVIRLADVPP